jgi:hypothetical protein
MGLSVDAYDLHSLIDSNLGLEENWKNIQQFHPDLRKKKAA